MKLFELFQLLEYRRDITARNYGDKLVQTNKAEGSAESLDKILTYFEEVCDPTKNKQYTEWICRQYINKQFRLEDGLRIRLALFDFENIKSRLPQNERDINKYTFHSLEDKMDKINNPELSNNEGIPAIGNTFPVIPNSKVLYNGPLGQLAIPETKEASCELGRGTKWCTASRENNYFDSYSNNAPLYIWRDKSGEKYQFYFGPDMQFMDARDRELSPEKINYFRTEHPVLSKLFKEQEKEIAKDPELVYLYARDGLKGRFPEGEEAIVKDPIHAYAYAKHIIKGRFPEGEAAIAKSPSYSTYYALEVIHGRFPEGEDAIATHINASLEYAIDVIKGRFPKGEKIIARSPAIAYNYAVNVINGRFPEGEPVIATSPLYASRYARNVINGRWPEGEAAIASDPEISRRYKMDWDPDY